MKLSKCNNRDLVENRDYPELLKCEFRHKVQETTANAEWLGPVIPPETWHQILAFFKWTYDTTHSESQVRLYVNTKLETWRAWAFPQEARTGMTARELQTPDAEEQRKQFPDSEGWIYLGTVHHHCSGGAFQSGTDESNEKVQDGLHITVGKLDEKRYDLHCRFYLSGSCFTPDMGEFWDIGEELMLSAPFDVWNHIAQYQMTTPAPAGTTFPDKWKENLIEVKHAGGVIGQDFFPRGAGVGSAGNVGVTTYGSGYACAPWNRTYKDRAREAASQLLTESEHLKRDLNKILEALRSMDRDEHYAAVYRKCKFANIDPDDILAAFDDMAREEIAEEAEQQAAKNAAIKVEVVGKGKPSGNGNGGSSPNGGGEADLDENPYCWPGD